MEKLVLLTLISVAYLCDAGQVHYNSEGTAVSGSKESEGVIEDGPQCGEIKSSNSGTDSKYKEFPWTVELFRTVNENQTCSLTDSSCWNFSCGGWLIGPKVVLSNGHCVYEYRQDHWKVRAGDRNLDTFEEPHPHQERFVEEIIIHAQFHDSLKFYERRYDVALLVLESPFTSADNIPFICLPPPDLNFAAASCKLTGWDGQIELTNGSLALLEVDVKYVDHDQCQRTLSEGWLSGYALHDSFTCVETLGEGPWPHNNLLLCVTENHYYARGLYSWSAVYDNTTHVYADVVKSRNWIDQTMRANGFPTDTYTQRL